MIAERIDIDTGTVQLRKRASGIAVPSNSRHKDYPKLNAEIGFSLCGAGLVKSKTVLLWVSRLSKVYCTDDRPGLAFGPVEISKIS